MILTAKKILKKIIYTRTFSRNRVINPELVGEHQTIEYKIGEFKLILPSEHKLPVYQQINPHYDNYFGTWLSHIKKENKPLRVLDIGANVGDTALYITSQVQNSEILCIEPSPLFFELLKLNVENNSLSSQIKCLNIAIVPREVATKKVFFQNDKTTGRLNLEKGEEISTIQIDELLVDQEFDLIKIDIDSLDILIAKQIIKEKLHPESVIAVELDINNLPIQFDGDAEITELFLEAKNQNYKVIINDNHGRTMYSDVIALQTIKGLFKWVKNQRTDGKIDIYYFDVWFLPGTVKPSLLEEIK
jgi:FkbM family methyltransferase